MSTGGIFELRTPRSLLDKLVHDLKRLRQNPTDAYAAFDFFVSARHMPEWIFPGNRVKCDALFNSHVELRICRHIADSGKHYIVKDPQHKQIKATEGTKSAWGNSWGRAWSNSWGRVDLLVRLDPADPDTGTLGTDISALELAEKTLAILRKLAP
jgi:hypothetical protein